MKTLKLSNGEIRKGYEFTDLSEDVKNKVLTDQVNFEIEIMDENSPYCEIAEKMDKMKTPWFLAESIFHDCRASLIDTIEANEYLFDIDGEMLPLQYHYNENKLTKTVFGKREYLVEFI